MGLNSEGLIILNFCIVCFYLIYFVQLLAGAAEPRLAE